MAKRGLARLDDLDVLARANGWTCERHIPEAEDLPPGCVEAHGWMGAKLIDDGRDFTVIIVYGKPDDGRGWQLLRDEGKWPVICSIDEPTMPNAGADWTVKFTAIADFEYWVPKLDDLIALWREEGMPARKTITERVRQAVTRETRRQERASER